MRLIHLQQNSCKKPMPLHPCKSHIEARQSTSESTEWPRCKPKKTKMYIHNKNLLVIVKEVMLHD